MTCEWFAKQSSYLNIFVFLTFLPYKSLQLRGGHFVYLSSLNEHWGVITRFEFSGYENDNTAATLK